MLKAHCHDQEYWIVQRTPCECGSPLSRGSGDCSTDGASIRRSSRRLATYRCERCGKDYALEFNISSFYGKP